MTGGAGVGTGGAYAAQPASEPGEPTAGGERAAYEIVRVDHGNWRTYRDVRLACLIESAPWFGTTYAGAARLSDAQWQERARSESLSFWLAMAGECPIGTVGLAIDTSEVGGPTGMLIGMWVVPRARGTGVAGALVDRVRAGAAARGCRRLLLHVHAQNARAQGLYRRRGFEPTGLISGGEGERDEVVMEVREW